MSRRTEKRERTTTDEVTVEVKCDWCGALAPNPQSHRPWAESQYQIIVPTVSIERGSAYPDNGHSVTEYFEICPECYGTKLVPWLKAQGLPVYEREADW